MLRRGWPENRRPLEASREAVPIPVGEFLRGVHTDRALPQLVVERLDARPVAERRVCQDDVEAGERQIGEELVGLPLAAHELDGMLGAERGLEGDAGQELWNRIAHAHVQADRAAGGVSTDRVEHLLAQREDVLRVREDTATELGEHEATPGPREERLAELRLQIRDLLADRGLRQAEQIAGGRDAAALRGRPETPQVIKVQSIHEAIIDRLLLYFKIWRSPSIRFLHARKPREMAVLFGFHKDFRLRGVGSRSL